MPDNVYRSSGLEEQRACPIHPSSGPWERQVAADHPQDVEESGLTGTAADRSRRPPGGAGATQAAEPSLRSGSEALPGAPGWRIVARPYQPAPSAPPQLAPLSEPPRASPLVPWIAGAALSLLVLALTVPDLRWLERLADEAPSAPEPVVTGAIDAAGPPTAEPSAAAPTTSEPSAAATPAPEPSAAAPRIEVAPFIAPPPYAKSAPRVVAISAEGRGRTTVEPEPQLSPGVDGPPSPEPRAAPGQPPAAAPHVVPISAERPQSALSPGVQLVGALADEALAPAERLDFAQMPPAANPAASGNGHIRVFIHYGAGRVEDAATAARLAQYLRQRDFEVADIRAVEIPIGSPGVRYFFQRDQAESRRLLDDLGWFFRAMPEQAPEETSDFTHYNPKPAPGNVEIWLPATS